MSGYDAEKNRRYVADNGLAYVRNSYLKYYKDYFDNIKIINEAVFKENADGSRSSFEFYEIESFWERDEDKEDRVAKELEPLEA